MKKTTRTKTSRTYAKLLLSLVLSIVATLFIVSVILYFNFVNVALSNINDSETASLSQTSSSVKFMNDSAHTLALQIYTENDITGTLENPLSNPVELSAAVGKLNMYRYISPFVHSIYVLNDTAGTVTISSPLILDVQQSKEAFQDKDALKLLDGDAAKQFRPIPRLIPDFSGGNAAKSTAVYSYVFRDSAIGSRTGRIVILNITESFIRETMQSLEAGAPSDMSIVDAEGRLVISGNALQMLADVSGKPYIKRIQQAESRSGYFVGEADGVKSLVIYVTNESLGWTFIRTIPYERIIAKIDRMKQATLLVGFAILAVGLAASYVLSRRLYKPIGSALSSLKTLEAEKRDRFFHEKQELLRNILRGKIGRREDPGKLFAMHRIKLQPDKTMVLLLLRIDRYAEFCSTYNAVDRGLMRFSVKNIALELCVGRFAGDAVDMENDQVVLLLNVGDEDQPAADRALAGLIARIQEAAQTYLQLSLSAVISSRFRWADDIQDVYEETEHASLFRLIQGHRSFIDVETMGEDRSDDYVYPFQKEQAFTDALLSRKPEEAKQKYADMVAQAVATGSHVVVQQTLTHLAFAVGRCLDMMKKNGSLQVDANYGSFITAFHQLETLEEINMHFEQLLDRLSTDPEEKKKSRYDEMIATIETLIHSEYGNPNLSLDSVADAIDMSPAYLGRLFKKLTGKSIPDVILDVRIDKAKELLAVTDAPIHEIADKVGFTNSTYFFKVFKKTNGVTPNEYRQGAAAAAAAGI